VKKKKNNKLLLTLVFAGDPVSHILQNPPCWADPSDANDAKTTEKIFMVDLKQQLLLPNKKS
jgi:hypothetical protein